MMKLRLIRWLLLSYKSTLSENSSRHGIVRCMLKDLDKVIHWQKNGLDTL